MSNPRTRIIITQHNKMLDAARKQCSTITQATLSVVANPNRHSQRPITRTTSHAQLYVYVIYELLLYFRGP